MVFKEMLKLQKLVTEDKIIDEANVNAEIIYRL